MSDQRRRKESQPTASESQLPAYPSEPQMPDLAEIPHPLESQIDPMPYFARPKPPPPKINTQPPYISPHSAFSQIIPLVPFPSLLFPYKSHTHTHTHTAKRRTNKKKTKTYLLRVPLLHAQFNLPQTLTHKQDAINKQAVGGALDFKVSEKCVCPEEREDFVQGVVRVRVGRDVEI